MPQQVKILDIRTLPSSDPKRMGKRDRMVIVEAGEGNRLIVTLPDETFSDDNLKAAIRAEMQERGRWVGQTIDV